MRHTKKKKKKSLTALIQQPVKTPISVSLKICSLLVLANRCPKANKREPESTKSSQSDGPILWRKSHIHYSQICHALENNFAGHVQINGRLLWSLFHIHYSQICHALENNFAGHVQINGRLLWSLFCNRQMWQSFYLFHKLSRLDLDFDVYAASSCSQARLILTKVHLSVKTDPLFPQISK